MFTKALRAEGLALESDCLATGGGDLYSDFSFITFSSTLQVRQVRPVDHGRPYASDPGGQSFARAGDSDDSGAYSPQARGRSERGFGAWQGRLPQELRRRQITTLQHERVVARDNTVSFANRSWQLERTKLPSLNLVLGIKDRAECCAVDITSGNYACDLFCLRGS